MSPRTWILFVTTALSALSAPLAHASIGPLALPLHVTQGSAIQRFAASAGNVCLVLDAGRPLGDQDAPGMQKLIADLDVHAGPGLLPEGTPSGAMPYTYSLVPELKGTKLVYRGLLSSGRANAVRVSARGPASLADVVERDLGFGGPVSLVFSRDCE